MKISVTGIGIISALGNSVDENFNSLKAEQCGIRKKTIEGLRNPVFVAQVEKTNEELAGMCKNAQPEISRTSLLGIKAAQECWGNNQLSSALKTGFISGTSVGGMDISEEVYKDYLAEKPVDFSPLVFHDSGNTTELIANALGIVDYVNTISTACSSASNAIMQGARLIQAGILDRVIVGGSDALTKFTINGFSSLMIYNENICQPFDENRNGLNLGEGAAYLLLEGEKSLQLTNNKVLATVSGWGNAADAFHQTATSPDAKGAVLSMNKALKTAGITANQIDYVNAHGTGTKNNDQTESEALKTIFGNEIPAFSSTKSYTGHTLAASGALEAVFCVLSLQEKVLFPNLHFKEVIVETGLKPLTATQSVEELTHVLSNSFGFGGNCTSLVFTGV